MSLERTVTDFVRALRASDVSVSTAETLDAVNTLRVIGYEDRGDLKNGLRCALAKTTSDIESFDHLFDLYFAREAEPERDGNNSEGEVSDDILKLAEAGNNSDIDLAIARAASAANVQDIRFSTQVSVYTQRILKEMGVEALDQAMFQALKEKTEAGDQRAEGLSEARKRLQERVKTHVKRQFDIYGRGATQQMREGVLLEKRLSDIDRNDFERMKPLVEKLARRLATKHSRRRRKARNGMPDLRQTLRRNAGRDGVPFDLIWKQKKKDRPKFVVICDVSNSVQNHVRFLLLFLQCLSDAVSNIKTYAFSSWLRNVDSFLTKGVEHFEQSMDEILHHAGGGATDYGQAFSDLRTEHFSSFDRSTSVIILGDARSNHGDPRTDLLHEIAARSKRLIWLNPEGRASWGSGDSEMLRYLPYCSAATHLTSIAGLEAVIDDVLLSYR